MKDEQVNTRLDSDDAGRLNQYAEERDITKAEAARRLIRAGLDAEEEGDSFTEGFLEHLSPSEIIVVAAILLLVGGTTLLAGVWIAVSGSVLLATGLLYVAIVSLIGGTVGIALAVVVEIASGGRVRDLAPWRAGEVTR